ncbi:hypothetical protein CFC21_086324 [Triticum aestivum]|uniref:F-box domain-containing protein n=2 Tax=Triticum aestivum TaxID=4565 RepID=A0A9R1IFC2_WHEAT|nr:MEIOTIC F-BOX protein MOF-like isoform X1 [Triticum aestivum]KAF7082453.1 hypothetical protein CFC21_086324 [Triticum aestivum]
MTDTSTAEESSKYDEEDRISALPDVILHHVLGFLWADEAVHTCLLARRWRYLWKSMRCILVYDKGWWRKSTHVFLNKFMDCVLLLRDPGSTLDEVHIEYDHLEDDHTWIDLWIDIWIRHALSCQAQVLTVRLSYEVDFCLDGPPVVSRHLRRLELSDVTLKGNFMNFSSCSSLEELYIEDCYLETGRILSQSLKHLTIKGCFSRNDGRIRVTVPNLVSLQLLSFRGRTPLFESMPSLETAVVEPNNYLEDYCCKGVALECCGICADCCGNDDHNGNCVLLGGLSHAKSLELTAYPGMLIFRRDLRWCPTFSKLKTLLLNEWCVQPDLRALVCMLEHSLVLENLTLQLCEQGKPTGAVEAEENHSLMEKPAAISGYLKIMKVKCEDIDGRVCKVLKFLIILGMDIIIQRIDG